MFKRSDEVYCIVLGIGNGRNVFEIGKVYFLKERKEFDMGFCISVRCF